MHLQTLAITINQSLIGHDRYYEARFGAGTPQQEAVPRGWKFSRIENLWPRDGSCPLPLRSKRIFNKCFRIVKTQKISRGGAAHVMGSPFAPNEVPAPVLQRRWPKSRYHARTAHEILKVRLPQKENTAHAVQAKDFVG